MVRAELVLVGLFPIGLPEELVKMVEREIEAVCQLKRQRRLSGSAATDDRDALQSSFASG